MPSDKVMVQALSAPELKTLSRSEVQLFLRRYGLYCAEVSRRGGKKDDVISLSLCLDDKLLRRIAKFNLKLTSVDDVTDDALLKFLERLVGARVSRCVDLRGLLEKGLRFDLGIEDPHERLSSLFGRFDELMEEEAGGVAIPAEEQCRFLLNALQPPAIRRLADNLESFEKVEAKKDPQVLFDVLWEELPSWERCLRIAGLFDQNLPVVDAFSVALPLSLMCLSLLLILFLLLRVLLSCPRRVAGMMRRLTVVVNCCLV
eukprot:Rmarinus@m.18698